DALQNGRGAGFLFVSPWAAVATGGFGAPRQFFPFLGTGGFINGALNFNTKGQTLILAGRLTAHPPFTSFSMFSSFLGLRFNRVSDGLPLYGWAHIKWTQTAGNEIDLLSWAYDDSGAAIRVGDTASAAVPEPGALQMLTSVGLLALGVTGLQ